MPGGVDVILHLPSLLQFGNVRRIAFFLESKPVRTWEQSKCLLIVLIDNKTLPRAGESAELGKTIGAALMLPLRYFDFW